MDSLEQHERVLALSRLVDQWADENLGGEPDWRPLENVIPREWCGGFMWMSRGNHHGVTVELYKHGITRHYLNLDRDGNAYRYTGEGYVLIPQTEAIDWVFDGLKEAGWTRETLYDDEFRIVKYKALREAGWTVVTSGSGARSRSLDDEQEHPDRDHCEQRD